MKRVLAIGAGWLGINKIMHKPDLRSRAQRLTIVAVIFVYGLFVLAALIGGLDTPSGFSLTRFLIEGVLVGAIAGLVTYGIAQTIHWAITGQRMKSTTIPQDSKIKTEEPVPTRTQKEDETWKIVDGTVAVAGIIGNTVMMIAFSFLWEDSSALWLLLLGLGIVTLGAWWAVSFKRRSALWLFLCIIPLGWLVHIALKNHDSTKRAH